MQCFKISFFFIYTKIWSNGRVKKYLSYLSKGLDILSIEVVQRLVNPALLHMLKRFTFASNECQKKLFVSLSLEVTETPINLWQNTSCQLKSEKTKTGNEIIHQITNLSCVRELTQLFWLLNLGQQRSFFVYDQKIQLCPKAHLLTRIYNIQKKQKDKTAGRREKHLWSHSDIQLNWIHILHAGFKRISLFCYLLYTTWNGLHLTITLALVWCVCVWGGGVK